MHSTVLEADVGKVDWQRWFQRLTVSTDDMCTKWLNLSGNSSEMLMNADTLTWMMLIQENLSEYVAVTRFRSNAHAVVLGELVQSHGWTEEETKTARIDLSRLLFCTGSPGQPMPTSTSTWHHAQVFVAVTDDLIAPKMYDKKLLGPEPAQDASETDWDEWAFGPLTLPPPQMEDGLMDFGETPWRAGTVGVLSGPRVLYTPTLPAGTLRVMYCFAVRRRADAVAALWKLSTS